MSSEQFVGAQLRRLTSRIVHAHQFNKASSNAVDIIVDLLSRYLELLAGTCAQYAQHTGRTGANALDAVVALQELGLDVDELKDWCERDGLELAKYTGGSGRAVEQFGGGFNPTFQSGFRGRMLNCPLRYLVRRDEKGPFGRRIVDLSTTSKST